MAWNTPGSIMERARLAALSGDKMLAMPFICFVGL